MLTFISGIEFLVKTWSIDHGLWFWIAISLVVQITFAMWACWKKFKWSHLTVFPFTGAWLLMQFFAHWLNFIRPPKDKYIIESYYNYFNTWYLIPAMKDRTVPDGYHIILSFLLLVCFLHGIYAFLLAQKNSS